MKVKHPMAAGLAALALAACQSEPVKEPVCDLPETKQVKMAFVEARSTLAEGACHYRFFDVQEALLRIAAGDPGQQNKAQFAEFYRWSADQGVISKLQAKAYFSSYFTPSFKASLPDDQNACSALRSADKIFQALKEEMKKKRQGLMDVLGDRNAYFRAKSRHDDLVFLLEATALACEEEA